MSGSQRVSKRAHTQRDPAASEMGPIKPCPPPDWSTWAPVASLTCFAPCGPSGAGLWTSFVQFPVMAALSSRVWTPDGAVSEPIWTRGSMPPSTYWWKMTKETATYIQVGRGGREGEKAGELGTQGPCQCVKLRTYSVSFNFAAPPAQNPLLVTFRDFLGGQGPPLVVTIVFSDRQASWAWDNWQGTRPRPSEFLNMQAFLCGLHLAHFLTFPLSSVQSHQGLPFMPLTSSQVTVPSGSSDALTSSPALAWVKDTFSLSLLFWSWFPSLLLMQALLRCSSPRSSWASHSRSDSYPWNSQAQLSTRSLVFWIPAGLQSHRMGSLICVLIPQDPHTWHGHKMIDKSLLSLKF